MPWLPELFTAPALARIWEDERRRKLALVPFFPGILTGEVGAIVESFAGEPELHHPVRGRIKGVAAFERYVAETRAWLAERAGGAHDVGFVIAGGRGVEETVVRFAGGELPVAIASDHDDQGRIVEQRMYFRTGAGGVRPPVLQADPAVRAPDAVGERLRGGMMLECCALTDDGQACALEYNLVGAGTWQAGLAVFAPGAADRIYDDVERPGGSAARPPAVT
jgi:hypothetical protein